MKTLLSNNKKFTAILFTACVLFALGNVAAQQKEFDSVSPKKKTLMLGNLKSGLHSENEGLRRSAINFTGYYQITYLVDELGQLLQKGKELNEKIIVLLALYKIGGEDSYRIIQDYVMSGNFSEARKLAKHILTEIAAILGPELSAK